MCHAPPNMIMVTFTNGAVNQLGCFVFIIQVKSSGYLSTSGVVADLKSSLILNGMVVEEFILIPSLEYWYGFCVV